MGTRHRIQPRLSLWLVFWGATSLTACAQTQLFSDNFTRGTDPGPLTPWVAQGGNWTVTGGALVGGSNTLYTYGFATLSNNWTNYQVEARIRFQAGGFGGGVGARVNGASGAHYAAWVYPEGSLGGSSVMKLVKFQNWTNFGYQGTSYAPVQQVSLPGVGTNWHIVKLTLQQNLLGVYYDGNEVMGVLDTEAQPYVQGGVSIDMWTASPSYVISVDYVTVTAVPSVPTASNDNYSVTASRVLTVPAPGVLANDLGGRGALTTFLATGPAHGVLNLNSNGGFVYTPASSFTGTDTFFYGVTDGITGSGTGMVSIAVAASPPPVANNDTSLTTLNTPLSVAPPGVLGNDIDPAGNGLTASLVGGTTHGVLNLNANGGFTYQPATNFVGTDSFTYQADDGQAQSGTATVTLLVESAATVFTDNFSRGTDPGPLTPWVAELGAWTVTGGALKGGTNSPFGYSDVFVTNSWSNYSVQGRLQFPPGGYGGALGGRLNTANGAHYAAWVYPEGSAGGSSVMRLVKFQDWTNFGYLNTANAPMAQVALPGVGTNSHTLKLSFQGNLITAQFDGNQVISTTDAENQPYVSGGICAEMWTDAASYIMSVDDVVVNSFLSGTNPPAPVLLSLGLTNNVATLVWSAVAGKSYQMQYKTNLSDSNWNSVLPDIVATGPTATGTNAVDGITQRLYRVMALP